MRYYTGSGDVLAHVDKLTARKARGELPMKLRIEILRNSLTDAMQREIVLHEKTTMKDIVKMLRQAFPKHCPSSSDARKSKEDVPDDKTFSKLVSAMNAAFNL